MLAAAYKFKKARAKTRTDTEVRNFFENKYKERGFNREYKHSKYKFKNLQKKIKNSSLPSLNM